MSAAVDGNLTQAIVSGLYVYPIKSCAGIALEQALLSPTGLQHDRRWMLVDAARRRFITQREQPRLALIKPTLLAGGLQLDAPGMPSLRLHTVEHAAAVEVTVWRDQCNAFDEGDAVAEWCSEFLQQPLRLMRFDDSRSRFSSREWSGDIAAPTHFPDGYPLLVIAQASLAELNSRLAVPLPMNRFRPNIVIDGVPAYGEDSIHELATAALRLRLVKPCTRCKITTTDQATGIVMGTEPLTTLLQYRRSAELNGVMFGQNAVIVAGAGGALRVGQQLTLTWRA